MVLYNYISVLVSLEGISAGNEGVAEGGLGCMISGVVFRTVLLYLSLSV